MTKRLYRSVNEQMVSGVCAGLGEYFDLDPTLIRLVFVLAAFGSGFFGAALVYLVLAVIVPEKPNEVAVEPEPDPVEKVPEAEV